MRLYDTIAVPVRGRRPRPCSQRGSACTNGDAKQLLQEALDVGALPPVYGRHYRRLRNDTDATHAAALAAVRRQMEAV
jgi:hypothetical protein